MTISVSVEEYKTINIYTNALTLKEHVAKEI